MTPASRSNRLHGYSSHRLKTDGVYVSPGAKLYRVTASGEMVCLTVDTILGDDPSSDDTTHFLDHLTVHSFGGCFSTPAGAIDAALKSLTAEVVATRIKLSEQAAMLRRISSCLEPDVSGDWDDLPL